MPLRSRANAEELVGRSRVKLYDSELGIRAEKEAAHIGIVELSRCASLGRGQRDYASSLAAARVGADDL